MVGPCGVVPSSYRTIRAAGNARNARNFRTGLALLKPRLVAFDYEVHRDDVLLFTGTTKHLVTRGTDRVVSLPREYMTVLARAQG